MKKNEVKFPKGTKIIWWMGESPYQDINDRKPEPPFVLRKHDHRKGNPPTWGPYVFRYGFSFGSKTGCVVIVEGCAHTPAREAFIRNLILARYGVEG